MIVFWLNFPGPANRIDSATEDSPPTKELALIIKQLKIDPVVIRESRVASRMAVE